MNSILPKRKYANQQSEYSNEVILRDPVGLIIQFLKFKHKIKLISTKKSWYHQYINQVNLTLEHVPWRMSVEYSTDEDQYKIWACFIKIGWFSSNLHVENCFAPEMVKTQSTVIRGKGGPQLFQIIKSYPIAEVLVTNVNGTLKPYNCIKCSQFKCVKNIADVEVGALDQSSYTGSLHIDENRRIRSKRQKKSGDLTFYK